MIQFSRALPRSIPTQLRRRDHGETKPEEIRLRRIVLRVSIKLLLRLQ